VDGSTKLRAGALSETSTVDAGLEGVRRLLRETDAILRKSAERHDAQMAELHTQMAKTDEQLAIIDAKLKEVGIQAGNLGD